MVSTGAMAQDLGVALGGGIATSRMDDMKYLQEYMMDFFPLEGEIISSFPAYVSASIGIIKQWYPNIRIGGGYAHTSTGGRANYTDYSGSYNINMTAVSNWLGASVSYAFLQGNWHDLSVYGKLGANINNMEITQSIYLIQGSDWSSTRYNTINLCGSLGLEYLVHLKILSFGVSGGYQVDLPGELKDKEDHNPFKDPVPANNRVLTTDWTGWRAGGKIIIWIGS